MADPLSIASGIAGLLTLSSALVGAGYRFVISVASAPEELAELIKEIAYLNSLLSKIVSFQIARPAALGIESTALVEQNIVLDCQAALQEVQELLQTCEKRRNSVSGRVLVSFFWPMKKKDITRSRERISRLCATMQSSISIESASRVTNIEIGLDETLKLTKDVGQKVRSSQDEKILDWLSTLNPIRKQAATTRLHRLGTYDWFDQEPGFLEWTSMSTLLWLNAPPGAGKTVLFSHIVNYLKDNIEKKAEQGVVVYHYCEFAVSDTLDPTQIIGSLLRQVVESMVELPQEIEDLYLSSRGQRLDQCMLVSLFGGVIRQTRDPMYILIDGLDECPDRQDLLSVIRGIQEDCKATSLIRVLLSSRPEHDLRRELSTECSFSIEAHHIERDLDIHIRAELASIPQLRALPDTKHEELVTTLVSRADGIFRWVQCQLDVLRKIRAPRDLDLALKRMPPGLYKTYDRILASVEPEDYPYILSMLKWLVGAYRPLHISELAEAIALDPNKRTFDREQDRLYDPNEVLDLCGSLIMMDESNTVKLAHASCKEYLLSTSLAAGPEITARFSITLIGSEHHITESLLTYGFTIGLHLYQVNQTLNDTEYPLLLYLRHARRSKIYGDLEALSSWFGRHFLIDGPCYDELLQVLNFVGLPALHEENYTVAFVLRVFLQSCSLGLLDGILTASSTWGFQSFLEWLKDRFVDWQSYWDDPCNPAALTQSWYFTCPTPLGVAACNNFENVAQFLLQRGARVDGIETGTEAIPLLKAVGCGSKDVFRVLMRHGANINICSPFSSHGGTALKRAAMQNADMLDLVMRDALLDPFLMDGRGLTIAYWIHHDSIVKRNFSVRPHYLIKLDKPELRTINPRIIYGNVLKLLESVSNVSSVRFHWAREELSNLLFSSGPSYHEFGAVFGEAALKHGSIVEHSHHCNICATNREAPMRGKRYRCLDCIDTDLCETCYKAWQLEKGQLSFCQGHTYYGLPRLCWYDFRDGIVTEDGKTLPQVVEYLKVEFLRLLQEST